MENKLEPGSYVTYADEKERKNICSLGCIEMLSPYDKDKCIVEWFTIDKNGKYMYMYSEEYLSDLAVPDLLAAKDLINKRRQMKEMKRAA